MIRYALVESFLYALELEPENVREVTVSARDRSVTITTYRLDPDGSKFVDPETNMPAVDVEVREITGMSA